MRGWEPQFPDSRQVTARFEFLSPGIHEHPSSGHGVHNSFPLFRVTHSAHKWGPHPKKEKASLCASPRPLAAYGVAPSLADRAGSDGHGE